MVLRRFQSTVMEDIVDWLHVRAVGELSSRDAGTKDVGISSIQSASYESCDHRMLGDACLDRDVIRRDMAHEDRTVAGLRSLMAQIVCDGVDGGRQQWKAVGEMRLGPRYTHDPVAPVDDVAAKIYNFGTTDP